ncbi:MAG: hypothetical protein ACXQTR_02050 [Candidatus Methanospirareceae archaeon]
MSELFSVHGETDGTSTSGDFEFYSDIVYGTFTLFRIPKGMKAKIWCKRISGAAVEVIINYTHDVTAPTPAWIPVDRENLASDGELTLEKRRPVVLRSITGKEAFKVSWSQATAAKSYVNLEIEITE